MARIVIDDENWQQHVGPRTLPDGIIRETGLEHRDYSAQPFAEGDGLRALPGLIPRDEWRERLKEQQAKKASALDVLKRGMFGKQMPPLDQKSSNYCWAYSSTMALMVTRAAMGLPYVLMSAHSVACQVKKFANVGGWCQQSMGWIAKNGCASAETWPLNSFSRSNVNETTKADASKYVITEWDDFDNRESMKDQLVTVLLQGRCSVGDRNYWSHSTLDLALLEIYDDWSIRVAGINSWGPNWGEFGIFEMKGSKAIPNNAASPRVAFAT